jgi:hypothetical protein
MDQANSKSMKYGHKKTPSGIGGGYNWLLALKQRRI